MGKKWRECRERKQQKEQPHAARVPEGRRGAAKTSQMWKRRDRNLHLQKGETGMGGAWEPMPGQITLSAYNTMTAKN